MTNAANTPNSNLDEDRDPGLVPLPVTRDETVASHREGDDLVLQLSDGRVMRVAGFFASEEMVLLVVDETGEFWLLEFSPAGETVGVEQVALSRLEEMLGGDAYSGDGTTVPQMAKPVLAAFEIEVSTIPSTDMVFLFGRALAAVAIIAGESGKGGGEMRIVEVVREPEPEPMPEPELVDLAAILADPASTEYGTDEFGETGLTGVSDGNLPTLRSLLGGMSDSERTTLTLDEVQELVALAVIPVDPAAAGFAVDTFTAAGVTGVDDGNLETLRSLLGNLSVSEREALTLDEVQELAGLATNLGDPASLTAEAIEVAGVTGVDDSSLGAIRSMLDSLDSDDASLSREQVQALVDIANEYAPDGGSFDAEFRGDLGFRPGRMTLDIDADGDGANDQQVELDVARGFNPIRARFDLNMDGTVDQTEAYRHYSSGQR